MDHNKPSTPSSPVLKGRLEAFSEQGSEGTHWSFYEDGKTGYDGLRCLEKGDCLLVFNDAAREEEIWAGTIDFDFEVNKQPLRFVPTALVQRVKGVGTVHGVQKGVDPEEWAKMFLDEKPALLIPRPKNP